MSAARTLSQRAGRTATLQLRSFARLSRSDRTALVEESERVVRFVEPEATPYWVR